MAGRSEKWLTDEEVEREIERLRGSEAVKLAQKKKRLDSKRRLYMYQLRQMERQGLALMEQGITFESISSLYDEYEAAEFEREEIEETGEYREWLKKIRLDKNLTHEQISTKCGISRQYYSFIESGERNVPVKTAKKIAEVLDFDWQKFYEG